MKSRLISFTGRLLIIPVAFSSLCLSLLVGIPTVHATESTVSRSDNHSPVQQTHHIPTIETQDQDEEPGCCTRVQMQHDTKAIVPNQDKAYISPLIAVTPCEIIPEPLSYLEPTNLFLEHRAAHQPFSLTGTVIKRE